MIKDTHTKDSRCIDAAIYVYSVAFGVFAEVESPVIKEPKGTKQRSTDAISVSDMEAVLNVRPCRCKKNI